MLIEVDPRYFPTGGRPISRVTPSEIRRGGRHNTSFDALVEEMVEADLAVVRNEEERRNRYD